VKLAYLLLAHHKPRQFARLLDAIHDPDDLFLVHVDRKAPAPVHAAIAALAAARPNLRLLPSRSLNWGGWSLAAIHLEALRLLLALDGAWRYFINLSGQDFPLKPPRAFREELAARPDRNYVDVARIDAFPPPDRIHLERRLRYRRYEWGARVVGTPLPAWRRRGVRTEWKGSGWYTLTRAFCAWIDADPRAQACIRALRHSYVPDEFLMQTLAMNGPFADTLAGHNRREIVWNGGAHPVTLTMDDRDRLLASRADFARKFDEDVDATILDLLADRIGLPDAGRLRDG
jgi:hypothetical protein